MKRLLYALFIFSFSLLCTPSVFGQKCSDYPCVIANVKKAMSAKNYRLAFEQLESAEGYPSKNVTQITELRKQLFNAVEKEKDEAKKQKDRAESAITQVQRQVDTVKTEKKRADQKAEEARILTEVANDEKARAQLVLNYIYFYNNNFGLAYDNDPIKGKYGFINKNLDIVIPFRYDEAFPFESNGLARVKKNDKYYLIDTFSNEYAMVNEINQIEVNTQAIDLSNKSLSIIPTDVLNSTQLKILILKNNQIKELNNDINKLSNLKILDIRGNRFLDEKSIRLLKSLKNINVYADNNEGKAQNSTPTEVNNNEIITGNLLLKKTYFIEKSLEYDKWLKSSGLGKILRVETVRVVDEAISLDLGFITSDADSVAVYWNVLKETFDTSNKGGTLEELLFYKMLYFMKINNNKGYVQLFNSYDAKKDLYVCFYKGIKFDENKAKVEVESKGCKRTIQEFFVSPIDLSKIRSISEETGFK